MSEGKVAGPNNNYDMVFVWSIDSITKLPSFTTVDTDWDPREQLPSMSPFYCLPGGILYRAGFEKYMNWKDFRLDQIGDSIHRTSDGSKDVGTTFELNPMFHSLRNIYKELSRSSKNKQQIVCQDLIEKCGWMSYEMEICQEAFNHQTLNNNVWEHSKRCMKLVNRRSSRGCKKYANVVVCDEGVVYGAAKILVAGLSSEVPIKNIYSVQHAPREAIFEKIQKRFGEKCSLVSITSNPETLSFAKEMKMSCWCADTVDSLKRLHSIQRDYLIGEKTDILRNYIKFEMATKS